MRTFHSFLENSRFFPRFRIIATQVSIGLVLLTGCDRREQMPKGTGASGNITGVLKEPDAGLEIINQLSTEQQRAFNFMHHAWNDAVIGVADNLSSEDQSLVEKIKNRWDSFVFVPPVKEDKRFDDYAQIITNAGTFVIEFGNDFTPDHVRNFALLVEENRFQNAPLVDVDGVAMLGKTSEPLYWLKSLGFGLVPMKGSLVMIAKPDGRLSATEIGICLEDQPKLKDRVTVIGGLASPDQGAVIDQIRQAIQEKPSSVHIERIEWSRRQGPLFQAGGARLPRMTAGGTADGLQASRETVEGMQMSVNFRSQPGSRFPSAEEQKEFPRPEPKASPASNSAEPKSTETPPAP